VLRTSAYTDRPILGKENIRRLQRDLAGLLCSDVLGCSFTLHGFSIGCVLLDRVQVYCTQLPTCMPPSLLIRGRRQQSLLVSMLTCRTGLSSPTLLRSISAGTRTSRRRALRAQSSGSRELQTPASPRPRAAKRWVRRVSTRSARAQSPGFIFARHLDAVVSNTEIALVLACAGGCIDGHGLEMFDHCICSYRVGLHRVHNFFTIRVRINQRHDQKRAAHHVFPSNISKNGVHAAFRPKTDVPVRNRRRAR